MTANHSLRPGWGEHARPSGRRTRENRRHLHMVAIGYYKLASVFAGHRRSRNRQNEEEHKMAEYDLIIRNGTIVDGTGGIPAYRGDVAVKDGKIAMISGRIKATATKEVDATGCIVAPGAIDLHNHYDLQLNWDPYATMSGWHGVTSVAI